MVELFDLQSDRKFIEKRENVEMKEQFQFFLVFNDALYALYQPDVELYHKGKRDRSKDFAKILTKVPKFLIFQ